MLSYINSVVLGLRFSLHQGHIMLYYSMIRQLKTSQVVICRSSDIMSDLYPNSMSFGRHVKTFF